MNKKRSESRLYIAMILASIVCIALAILVTVNNQERKKEQMPYVILGGMPIYVEYSGESIVYAENYESIGYADSFDTDFTPVQIGDIPILYDEDLLNAFFIYKDSYVLVKEIKYGKLYEKVRLMDEERVFDDFLYDNSTGAKICFIVPEINRGVAFAHPLCTEQISGLVFSAQFESLAEVEDALNIYVQKQPTDNPDIIGHITGQNLFGVTFSYDPNKFNVSGFQKIQLATRDEVKLGPAYVYTDFGDGLNLYEVEITSLQSECDYLDANTPTYSYNNGVQTYNSSFFQNNLNNNRFVFVIKDKRMLEKGITTSIGGMSGSPVIQNNKIVGFNGYGDGDEALAIYADIAYEALMDSYANESISYTPTYSASNHPLVFPGQHPVKYFVKGIGAKVDNINTTEYDIKPGDTILAFENETLFNYSSVNELIEWYREYGYSEVELTIERDGKIFEIMIEPTEDLKIDCFVYYYIQADTISMIDPYTFRYAIGGISIGAQPTTVYSGIALKSEYDYDSVTYINTIIANSEVVGTITDANICYYGFYEPFNVRSEELFEVAYRNEVKNGPAMMYLFDGNNGELPVDSMEVNIICGKDYITLEPMPSLSSRLETFTSFNIAGTPIFQNGRIVAVMANVDENDSSKAYAYYAIDVYNEMMNIK